MIIADVRSGQIETAAEFVSLYTDPGDVIRVGRHLVTMLSDAVRRWKAGDHSPEATRLVEFYEIVRDALAVHAADTAVAEAERASERRAATMVEASQPAPDIAHRMTGVGLHGLPLPDDVAPEGDFLVTRVATPEALMAFYIEHMRATGWTLDLDNSNPRTRTGRIEQPPHCYFTHPDLPGRYVAILTGPGREDPSVTRLSISEHDD